MITDILILFVLIIFSALFSGIETALMSVNMIKVNSLLKQKKKGSEALYRIKQDPHKLIITILIGNNLVNIGSASFATVVFTNLFGSSGVGIATGVMTFLILVFGEITPKTFAAQKSEKISLIVARPIEILSAILSPFVKFFGIISRAVTKLLGTKEEKQISEEELKTIVTMGRQEGVLSKEVAEIMSNVLEFEGTKAVQIMTPDIDVKMIDGDKKLKEVINFLIRTPYSRYPVYDGNEDNIVGILDVDDVLKYLKSNKMNIKVRKVVRPAYFIPESKEIDDLLIEFEDKDHPLAIVVDEYGHVSGLVTVEDILEEIVGDIFDKSKRKSVYIKKISNKLSRVDAKASIEEINRVLELDLKEVEFNTISGYIQQKLQRLPKKGDKIRLKNAVIEVDNVTKQGIKTVKVTKK